MKLRWLALLFPIRLALAVLLLLLAWHVWVFLRPRPRALSAAELGAVRAAARSAAQFVRDAAPQGPLRVGVAHLVNDPTDAATAVLKEEFARQPGFTVETGSVINRFLGDIARAIGEATSLDEVVHAARRVELDLVVGGRLRQVEASGPSHGRADLQVFAFDARAGAWLARDTFEGAWQPDFAGRTVRRILGMGAAGRTLLWLVVVVILPWATFCGTRWAMKQRNNLASFILIMTYTLAGLLLAAALSGFRIVGAAAWWRMFGAFILCAAYNYWACEKIATTEPQP